MKKSLLYGVIGGLVSTAVMDLLSLTVFIITGGSFPSFFAQIGRTILTLLGIQVDFPLWQGLVMHYSIGILLGIFLSLASQIVPLLQFNSLKKSMLICVIFIEAIGLVLFYLMSVILNILQSEMMLIYISGLFLHGIGGICLGLILFYSLRQKPAKTR